VPQLAAELVPDDVVVVVVAVQAERLAEAGVAGFVAGEADGGLAVVAGDPVAAWVAGVGAAPVGAGVPVHRAGVDRAEGRGGEGGEHRLVAGDGRGDALAADQASTQELVGVAAVDLGAGQADQGAAVAAGFVDVPVGQLCCGPPGEALAGGPVDGVDGAGQSDGSGAAGGGADVVVSRPGFVGDSQPCEGRSHASTEEVPG
jgi:hypothetical protein